MPIKAKNRLIARNQMYLHAKQSEDENEEKEKEEEGEDGPHGVKEGDYQIPEG